MRGAESKCSILLVVVVGDIVRDVRDASATLCFEVEFLFVCSSVFVVVHICCE